MKNSSIAACCAALIIALAPFGITPSTLAQPTTAPTIALASTPTKTLATSTVTATVTVTAVLPTPTLTRRASPTATLPVGVTPSMSTARSVQSSTSPVTTTTNNTSPAIPAATAVATSNAPPTAVASNIVAGPANVSSQPKYTLSLDPKALDIESLRARTYGGGQIKITRVLANYDEFKRVMIEYPSDGLRITGMMNIPRGDGPFPVVVLDHGYFKPSEYKTGDGTVRAADSFVKSGYLTLAPDYRCYAGSQCGPNPLYVGYAVDVLNLIASLSSLPYADTSRIGIWGHSMGGGITIRVLTISEQIKVASLYGSLNSDDEIHYCWLNTCRAPAAPTRALRLPEFAEADPDFVPNSSIFAPVSATTAPDPFARLHEIFLKSSPSRHLNHFNTPVIIHHGENDDTVPIQWSVDLADSLAKLGKSASLYTYPGEGHVFAGWNWQLFMSRTLRYFDEYLNPRGIPVTAEKRVLRQERSISDSSY